MPRFKHYNYDQDAMVVINYQEQLQPGTFEHAVHYLIEHKLDLSVFHPKYRNQDTGRLAYDPAILLKIILFAYSKGITSSREMQWCCETNIIFKALSCDTVPHFTTLAKFVSSHADEIEELFEQILLVCHEQGLLGNELFAIDGCKMSSNAAKEWSGTFKELGEKRDKLRRLIRHHLKEHYEKDEAETEAELDRDIRRAKTVVSLDDSLNKVDRFLKTNQPRMGRGKRSKEVKSNITDNQSAKKADCLLLQNLHSPHPCGSPPAKARSRVITAWPRWIRNTRSSSMPRPSAKARNTTPCSRCWKPSKPAIKSWALPRISTSKAPSLPPIPASPTKRI